jgi:hypothetical protein
MSSLYTLTLLRDGARAEWSRVMPFASDAEAIAAARRIAESQIRKTSQSASLLVGRTWDEGQIAWLGGWDCDVEAGLSWEPETSDAGQTDLAV